MKKAMKNMSASHGGHAEMPMPATTELHVILHGLICVRFSYAQRIVEVHFPSVTMHQYHYGSYIHGLGRNPDARKKFHSLPYGHDYQLGGVLVGNFNLDAAKAAEIKDQHLALCLSEHPDLKDKYHPHGTHATVKMPWPHRFGHVRRINSPTGPLFPNGSVINPGNLFYIPYLTYKVAAEDSPVLIKGCQPIWSSEALDAHNRLHFFADPAVPLKQKAAWEKHVKDAYHCFGDQIFSGGLDLKPNTTTRWQFGVSEHPVDIPDEEATDFNGPTTLGNGADGGNCVTTMVLD